MSVPSAAPLAPTPATPLRENIGRGMLAALVTLPAGMAVWVIVWSMGFISAIVGALVAFASLKLYVWGAGRISRAGAAVVLVTTAITLVAAFLAGIAYDAAVAFGEGSGLGTWGAFTHPDFWPLFGQVLPEAMPEYTDSLIWALLFGALGSFATLRTAFAAARAEQAGEPRGVEPTAPDAAAPAAPVVPVAGAPVADAPAATVAPEPPVAPSPRTADPV